MTKKKPKYRKQASKMVCDQDIKNWMPRQRDKILFPCSESSFNHGYYKTIFVSRNTTLKIAQSINYYLNGFIFFS